MPNLCVINLESKRFSALRSCSKSFKQYDQLLTEFQELDELLKKCHKTFKNGGMKWGRTLITSKQ